VSCKITSSVRKCGVELFVDGVDGRGEHQSIKVGWGDDRDASAVAARAYGVHASPFICRLA